MAGGREVDADLMCASGLDRHLDEREAVPVLEKASAAPRPLSRRAHGVDRPEKGVGHEADGMIENRFAPGKKSRHEASIASLHFGLP